VPEPNTAFLDVAAVDAHSLGLKAGGSIIAWGTNEAGQCDVPKPNVSFIAVAARKSHSLGLKVDGSIVAWGDNSSGQCNVPEPNTGFLVITEAEFRGLGIRREVPDLIPTVTITETPTDSSTLRNR
jgi:trimeric autotransporter adhesin